MSNKTLHGPDGLTAVEQAVKNLVGNGIVQKQFIVKRLRKTFEQSEIEAAIEKVLLRVRLKPQRR